MVHGVTVNRQLQLRPRSTEAPGPRRGRGHESGHTPSAVLAYHIPPPTPAIIHYAIRLEKLSANGQVFVGAQIAVSL